MCVASHEQIGGRGDIDDQLDSFAIDGNHGCLVEHSAPSHYHPHHPTPV